ncbi:MAG: DUF2027 domain-containing protein [Muribaculaceae bacterium]|nr:DUF2027 domain-containing protein [Muribaculaceae bacterium]
MAAKIGDTVRFLNDVGGGVVVRIKDNMAYVADEDGFETPMLLRECVVVAQPSEAVKPVEAVIKPTPKQATPTKAKDPEPIEEPIEEIEGGDSLNVVVAFEAHDLKRLSNSGFDAYLVNDSNYYLYFTFSTRSDNDECWTARYAGVVEPNFQLLLTEFEVSDLPNIDRMAVQFIAFKRDKGFALKAPVAYETRIDSTKFARLHCFHENIYFEQPVIAYEIVKDDVPQRGAVILTPTETESPEQTRKHNEKAKAKPVKRHVFSARAQKNNEPIVVDLHANELLDTTSGMSNADILNYQIDKFREVMDENLRYEGRRIIFIHGKGEGILRQALLKELNYRYKGCRVQDASFREYGYGATQVTISSKS